MVRDLLGRGKVEGLSMKRMALVSGVLVLCAPLFCGFLFSKSVGKIKSDTAGVIINLEGPWWSKAKIGPEAKAVELKTGKYKAKRLERTLEHKTADGAKETWRLYSVGPWGGLSKIKVNKDKTTVLKFGGTVTLKTDMKMSKPARNDRDQRRIVTIGLKVVGEYGEEYYVRALRKSADGKSKGLKQPALRIIDESGKELANGKFAFG